MGAALALAALAAAASAAPLTINNSSFEADGGGYGAPTDWNQAIDSTSTTITTNNQRVTGIVGATGTYALSYYLDHNGGYPNPPDVPAIGSLGVDSTAVSPGVFAANTVYTLTAALGTSDNANSGLSVGLGLAPSALTLATLNASNSVLFPGTSFAAPNAVVDASFVLDTSANPGVVGQPIVVNLLFKSTYSYGRQGLWDNVRLDASPVPEPASLGLLGLGAVALLRRRR
jgi:hypothetical protein